MNAANESTRILQAESLEQLLKIRDAEISRALRLRLILQQLRTLESSKITENTQNALNMLKIVDFLRLEKDNEYLLSKILK